METDPQYSLLSVFGPALSNGELHRYSVMAWPWPRMTGPFGHGIEKMGHGHWRVGQVMGIDRWPKMTGLFGKLGAAGTKLPKD
jgi:hypothetical protein